MTTWFTSDLHFGHRNIIDYCSRPFVDVETMNAALIANWNETVRDDDTVWVLGDYAMGTIEETLPITGQLAGHKVLVAGNHDRCWFGHGDTASPWVQRYLNAGFVEIVQGSTSLALDERTDVTLCHFPYSGDSHSSDRFVEHRPVDDGQWLLHGHVHETWAQSERMINVGADVSGYRPISAQQILDVIASGPGERVSH